MAQMVDEAGNVWEVDASGNPVRYVGKMSGQQGAPRPVTIGQPNQARMRAERRADAADARSAAADARAAAAADRAAREWDATHNPDGSPKAKASGNDKPMPDGVAKRYEEAINAFASLDRAANGFQNDYAGNTLTGGLENSIQNAFSGFGTPGQAQWWADFKATDNVLRNALYGASLTAGEKAAYEATTISPSMDPKQVRANLTRRMELARDVLSRRTNFLKANGYNPDAVDALAGEYAPQLAAPAKKPDGRREDAPPLANPRADAGGSPPSPWDNGPTGPMNTIASGATRNVSNDRVAKQIDAMMNAGASKELIDTVLQQQGIPPISAADYNAAKAWMQRNPGKAYYGARNEQTQDMGYLQRLAGSRAGSFFANMADAATAGVSTALAGDQGRAALAAMNQVNPDESVAGSILGGITGAGLAEAGVAARAPAAVAKYAPRIADAGYGALSGFNAAPEGEGGTGALTGAAAGLAGGLLGEGVTRGAGAAFRGVTNPAVRALRQRGIPVTVGQALGGGAKKIEDALTSLPFVGNMIDARRIEGLRGFNRAAFDIGSETIPGVVGDVGMDGIQQLDNLKSNAYTQALGPVRIDAAEPQFAADLAAIQQSARAIPDVNGAQGAAIAGLNSRIGGAIDPTTNAMTGRGFQEAYRGLARTARERASSDYGHEVGQVMRGGQDALAAALERQNPGAFQGFTAANAANRRLNVLADAVNAAKNQEGQLFTPAQLNMADTASAKRLTSNIAAASGNRPFAALANAGQAVLPSKLPDSGTATRALVGAGATGLLGGGGYMAGGGEGATTGSGLGLLATLALAAGGTKGAQSLAVRGLLDRPDLAVLIGEGLKRNARVGSATGAGLGAYLSALGEQP